MVKKHIDKIAAPREPDRREGSPSPRVQGTESLAGGSGGTASPLRESGMGYGAERSIPDRDPDSGGTGVLCTPGKSAYNDAFEERNRILKEDWGMLPIMSSDEYFRVLFSRSDALDRQVNYMQGTGRKFWGDRHYNAVAYNLYPIQVVDKRTGELVMRERAEKIDITRDLIECQRLNKLGVTKVISSPILYAGRSRRKDRARSIWGIAIDVDDVTPANLRSMRLWIDKLDYIPEPSMIVSSGGGLHIYYLFRRGVGTQSSTVKALQRLKHNATKKLWNDLLSSNPDPDLHQGIWQGYRVPGTPTKSADVSVVGYVPVDIPYYTVRELNKYFRPESYDLIQRDNKPLTEAEIEAVDNNKYLPSEISYPEARLKWPNWDPSKEAGQWTANRKLYDWWLNQVIRGGQAYKKDYKGTIPLAVGRRYYWMMSLVAFGKKCGIPYDELEKDAYSLLEIFDSLSVSDDNRFTTADVEAALKLYKLSGKQSVARFKKAYIGAKTHFQFKDTKRNGRSRAENLIIARTARAVNDRMRGREWDRYNGRKVAERRVQMWCFEHPYSCNKSACAKDLKLNTHTVAKWWWRENPLTIPEAIIKWKASHVGIDNKSLCARECGITRPTAIKWWNCTAEDAAAEYERIKAVSAKGLLDAVDSRKRKKEIGDKAVGAAASASYIQDKRVASNILSQVPGYDKLSKVDQAGVKYDSADAFNAYFEELYKMMLGIPESARPFVHIAPEKIEELKKELESADFSEDLKTLEEDMEKWPQDVKDWYRKMVDSQK